MSRLVIPLLATDGRLDLARRVDLRCRILFPLAFIAGTRNLKSSPPDPHGSYALPQTIEELRRILLRPFPRRAQDQEFWRDGHRLHDRAQRRVSPTAGAALKARAINFSEKQMPNPLS